MIDKDVVEHIAEISKLSFVEDGIEGIAEKLSGIVEYVEKLNELDLKDVEPTYHVNKHIQKFREDIVEDGLSREEVLSNAPEEQYGYFKILKIVE